MMSELYNVMSAAASSKQRVVSRIVDHRTSHNCSLHALHSVSVVDAAIGYDDILPPLVSQHLMSSVSSVECRACVARRVASDQATRSRNRRRVSRAASHDRLESQCWMILTPRVTSHSCTRSQAPRASFCHRAIALGETATTASCRS